MGSKQVPDELCERCKPCNPMMLIVLQVGALLEARACVDALAQKGQGLRNSPFFLEAYLLVTEKSRKSPEKKCEEQMIFCICRSLTAWRNHSFDARCVETSGAFLGSVREIGWKRFAFDEIVQYLVQVRKKVSLDSKNTQWPYQCIFQLSHRISWTWESCNVFKQSPSIQFLGGHQTREVYLMIPKNQGSQEAWAVLEAF